MGVLTTYVCDCCGGQSQDRTKFETVPVTLNLNTWVARIDNVLLCVTCATTLVATTLNEITVLQGSHAGEQL